MSKIINPQDKKRLSYAHDRRNGYGESNKGSRKTIRTNKRMSAQAERSALSGLQRLRGLELDEDFAAEVEGRVTSAAKLNRLRGFRKSPDQPLMEHVRIQLGKRIQRFGRRAFHQGLESDLMSGASS